MPMNHVLSILLREPDDEVAQLALASDEFGMTPTRYYQVINQLLDTPEAIARAPKALQRYAARRQARRAWRRPRN